MATALKLYTKDQNLNAISKTVSNVNPVATDYVLKNFSEQLTNLSENTLQKVERIDTKDITDATDGGGTAVNGFSVASSSPFFSTDSDTYVAAFDTLTAVTGYLDVRITREGSISDMTVQLVHMKNAKNLPTLIDLINHSAYIPAQGYTLLTASQITNGIHMEPYDTPAPGKAITKITLRENEDARNENVAAWLKSVGENLIQVPGYKAEYKDVGSGAGTAKAIELTRL